jgi:hypothetical protein
VVNSLWRIAAVAYHEGPAVIMGGRRVAKIVMLQLVEALRVD